ncbi:MAG: hypothetical protein IJT59_07155 [Desulfovibrionaceae bacterium]|nr:hypothetical protein [Desulfovibrionaceae bacterium]
MITKPQRSHEIADNAYNYVRKYRLLADHCEECLEAYRGLLNQLPALNAQVDQRMQDWPGIANDTYFLSRQSLKFRFYLPDLRICSE